MKTNPPPKTGTTEVFTIFWYIESQYILIWCRISSILGGVDHCCPASDPARASLGRLTCSFSVHGVSKDDSVIAPGQVFGVWTVQPPALNNT